MLKYFITLKSRFSAARPFLNSPAVHEFLAALALLGVALYFALAAQDAARRGDSRVGIIFSVAALLLALLTALTIVPRLARRVRFRWLFPFTFSITREGGLYLLAVFILSMAAMNTGNNLLFMILATMLSAIIVSGIVARGSLRAVTVLLQVPENVFEGERISIKVSLKNIKRIFPAFSISVEDLGVRPSPRAPGRARKWPPWEQIRSEDSTPSSGSVLHHSAYFPAVLPGEIRTELVMQSFPRRGPYRLEGFRLSTRFPLGLFRRGERVRAEGEVLVYPSIREVSSYFHLLPFLPGHLEGMHTGHGESLHSIRKYQEGESARLVDWKATAKTRELMAREYAREEESKFCLILDTVIHPCGISDYADSFEKAVSLAASLAAHFCREGAEVEFLTPDEYVPRGMGMTHLYRILRSLAVVSFRLSGAAVPEDLQRELSGDVDPQLLQEILSDKVFKIIITTRPRGSFSTEIWRSSHVIYFDEL